MFVGAAAIRLAAIDDRSHRHSDAADWQSMPKGPSGIPVHTSQLPSGHQLSLDPAHRIAPLPMEASQSMTGQLQHGVPETSSSANQSGGITLKACQWVKQSEFLLSFYMGQWLWQP